MRRADFYIIGLVLLQVFIFLHLSAFINAGAGVSMMQQGDLDGYLSIALFVAGYAIVFGNLARLALSMTRTEEYAMEDVFKTFRLSVVGLIVLTALEFIQAFILLNVPIY